MSGINSSKGEIELTQNNVNIQQNMRRFEISTPPPAASSEINRKFLALITSIGIAFCNIGNSIVIFFKAFSVYHKTVVALKATENRQDVESDLINKLPSNINYTIKSIKRNVENFYTQSNDFYKLENLYKVRINKNSEDAIKFITEIGKSILNEPDPKKIEEIYANAYNEAVKRANEAAGKVIDYIEHVRDGKPTSDTYEDYINNAAQFISYSSIANSQIYKSDTPLQFNWLSFPYSDINRLKEMVETPAIANKCAKIANEKNEFASSIDTNNLTSSNFGECYIAYKEAYIANITAKNAAIHAQEVSNNAITHLKDSPFKKKDHTDNNNNFKSNANTFNHVNFLFEKIAKIATNYLHENEDLASKTVEEIKQMYNKNIFDFWKSREQQYWTEDELIPYKDEAGVIGDLIDKLTLDCLKTGTSENIRTIKSNIKEYLESIINALLKAVNKEKTDKNTARQEAGLDGSKKEFEISNHHLEKVTNELKELTAKVEKANAVVAALDDNTTITTTSTEGNFILRIIDNIERLKNKNKAIKLAKNLKLELEDLYLDYLKIKQLTARHYFFSIPVENTKDREAANANWDLAENNYRKLYRKRSSWDPDFV